MLTGHALFGRGDLRGELVARDGVVRRRGLGMGEPEWLGRASVGASERTDVAHLRVRPSSS